MGKVKNSNSAIRGFSKKKKIKSPSPAPPLQNNHYYGLSMEGNYFLLTLKYTTQFESWISLCHSG